MRKLFVSIYKKGKSDCTNGGASSRYDYMTAFDGDIKEIENYVRENSIDIDECLYVVRRESWGEQQPYLTPLAYAIKKPNGIVMFGGNYCKGDSRWKEWFGHYYPLPIHDRCETQEEYERMSI